MSGMVLALGSVLVVSASVWAAVSTGAPASVTAAFAAGVTASMVRVPSPRRRRWTLAPMVLVAASLIGAPPWPGSVAIVAGAVVTRWALVTTRTREALSTAHAFGVASMFLALAGARLLTGVPLGDAPRLGWLELAGVFGAGVVWFVTEAAAEAASLRASPAARRHRLRLRLADWPIATVGIATAVTMAVLWRYSLGWAIAMSIAPYGIAHHLGVRVARGREIAGLTVRALGRLPEAAGLSAAGHAEQVAALAVAMAKLDGLVGAELEELEMAAQLHDIGLLGTTTSPFRTPEFSSSEVAGWGADILAASRALRPAADIVRSSRDPFRYPGADPDPGLDRRSQIVQVACRVVDAVESGNSLERAIETLYDHSLYQLDPHVVALVRPAAVISDVVLDELARGSP